MSSDAESIHELLQAVDLQEPADADPAPDPLTPQTLFPATEGENVGGVEEDPSGNNVAFVNNVLPIICFDKDRRSSSVCGEFVGVGDITFRFCIKTCVRNSKSCGVEKHKATKFIISDNTFFIMKGNTAFCQPTMDATDLSEDEKQSIMNMQKTLSDWASYFMAYSTSTADTKVKMEKVDKSIATLKRRQPLKTPRKVKPKVEKLDEKEQPDIGPFDFPEDTVPYALL